MVKHNKRGADNMTSANERETKGVSLEWSRRINEAWIDDGNGTEEPMKDI